MIIKNYPKFKDNVMRILLKILLADGAEILIAIVIFIVFIALSFLIGGLSCGMIAEKKPLPSTPVVIFFTFVGIGVVLLIAGGIIFGRWIAPKINKIVERYYETGKFEVFVTQSCDVCNFETKYTWNLREITICEECRRHLNDPHFAKLLEQMDKMKKLQ